MGSGTQPAQPNWWQALIITQVPSLLSTLMGLIGMAIQHAPADHPATAALTNAQSSLSQAATHLTAAGAGM